MTQTTKKTAWLGIDSALLATASVEALRKLNPIRQLRNPVMFVVWIGALLTTGLGIAGAAGADVGGDSPAFVAAIAALLWFTVLFANLAEALAEGRGRAHAASLRQVRQGVMAKRLRDPARRHETEPVAADQLMANDVVLVEAGELVPRDGEVIEGTAAVNESAITGESAPVIRQSGGDLCSVTGGTRVVSDWLVVRILAAPGDSFLDRMIRLVESASRRKTPNEIALEILLAFLTLVFLVVCVTLMPYSIYAVTAAGVGVPVTVTVLIALLVCLIPTTIGGLLSAIGIAGMDRMVRANVIAKSGRAVEAAGDVSVLLIDKTGTITYGNRQASEFVPAPGISQERLAKAAMLASVADDTPEGRSIVVLAQSTGLPVPDLQALGGTFVPFSAHTRMSGVHIADLKIKKGAPDAITRHVKELGGSTADAVDKSVERIARDGATPLLVSEGNTVLGAIRLKDVLKPKIAERFADLRAMGIKTIMVTGDNPMTAAAIAAEAGVDDYLAEATPERKLEVIREYQARGEMVAMTGDGTNDAPALAQADVAVAMNAGTQAAKEAANMVDLDSDPAKLLRVVETGKQMLITRGALTTFSVANDVAKYFAIVPAAFATTYPELKVLDIMHLTSPTTAILSAVIFNALVIVALIPLALKGVKLRHEAASSLLARNLMIYGVGGVIVPFPGIKLIDMLLTALGVA